MAFDGSECEAGAIVRKAAGDECRSGIDEEYRKGAMNQRPRFQHIWTAFDFLVRRRFGASIPIDKETGYADAAAVCAHAARNLLSNAESLFPPVTYETEFWHRDGEWRPYREVLTGVPREEEFLREVKWFFEEFCRSNEFTLAGIEEPRMAARRFLPVNYFTLSDDIRIDVKGGDLYTKNHSGSGWTLIFSELWVCPSTDLDALARTMNNEPGTTPNAVSETGIRIVAPNAHVPSPEHAEPPGQSPPVSTPKSGSGELEVWNYLRQWKERDPEFHKGRSKSAIARVLGELPQFAEYMPQTLDTYVRRALRDPSF